MNRRVATVAIPHGLRPPAALRLPTRRKIAEQNFDVQIQTEFQPKIPRWLVASTLSNVALPTAKSTYVPSRDPGLKGKVT
jgi:hypothetical protein